MVSTRSNRKNAAAVAEANHDKETKVLQKEAPQPELHIESEDDSDAEAPEAISTTTAKSTALQSEQAEREAKTKLAAEEKEKRRLRDQRLKEQKQASKKTVSKKMQQEETAKVEEKGEDHTGVEEDVTVDESNAVEQPIQKTSLPKLLPQEFLEQFAKDEKAEKKRVHLSAKDFERMAEEEEMKAQKQKSKKRNLTQGKQVGEYTVKVLSKRPKPQPIDQSLIDFRNQHFARAEVPRRDAVLNANQGRKGAATTFARIGKINKNKK